jgi:hypothetical protein
MAGGVGQREEEEKKGKELVGQGSFTEEAPGSWSECELVVSLSPVHREAISITPVVHLVLVRETSVIGQMDGLKGSNKSLIRV